tara:strand:+ start:99 stop:632 length:534 start_codon:yes stop_codon:yes gene_type:complete
MRKFCRENLEIEIHHHPHHQRLNEKLMNEFSKLNFVKYDEVQNYTNIRGSQFNFNDYPSSVKPKGVTLIENWVKQIIKNNCPHPIDFDFRTWVARLDKGQQTLEHDHLYVASHASVYFVNAPKGSSPLVFPTSGTKIKAEPGKLVLFPASLHHKVPVNKCDNRVTIASNITVLEKLM